MQDIIHLKLMIFHDILASTYQDKSYEPANKAAQDGTALDPLDDLEIQFKMMAQKHRKELRATMDLAMVKYNITADDVLWLGTFTCLVVFVPLMWAETVEYTIEQTKLAQFGSYDSWLSHKKYRDKCSTRCLQAIHDLVLELLQPEINTSEQKLTTRSWALHLDMTFYGDKMKIIRPHVEPIWRRFYNGYHSMEKRNNFHVETTADVHLYRDTVEEESVHYEFPADDRKMPPPRDVPKTQYRQPSDIKGVEKRFLANKNARLKKEAIMFSYAVDRTKQWIAEQSAQIDESLKQKHLEYLEREADQDARETSAADLSERFYHPVPKFKKPQIKQTAATILREEAILKKRTEEERKRLEDTAAFGRNARENIETYYEMKQQEEEDLDRARKARLKITAQLAREEALLARQKTFEEKKKITEQMKAESMELSKAIDEQQQYGALEKMELVKTVHDTRDRVQEATQRVVQQRRQMVGVIQSKWQIEKQRLQEMERRERDQLQRKIQEIKEQMRLRKLEREEGGKNNVHDSINDLKYGLLSEMTTNELRQHLETLKQEQQRQIDERKRYIAREKAKLTQQLQEKSAFIRSYKNEMETRSVLARSEAASRKSFVSEAASRKFKEVDDLQHKLNLLKQKTGRISQR